MDISELDEYKQEVYTLDYILVQGYSQNYEKDTERINLLTKIIDREDNINSLLLE